MHLWKCATCQSGVNPIKSWVKLDKFIVCSKCQNLSAIDRSHFPKAGMGMLGAVTYLLSKQYFGQNAWQAALIIIPIIMLIDIATIKTRKVGVIEAKSITGRS